MGAGSSFSSGFAAHCHQTLLSGFPFVCSAGKGPSRMNLCGIFGLTRGLLGLCKPGTSKPASACKTAQESSDSRTSPSLRVNARKPMSWQPIGCYPLLLRAPLVDGPRKRGPHSTLGELRGALGNTRQCWGVLSCLHHLPPLWTASLQDSTIHMVN